VPEYCGRLEEEQVADRAFELIFAFDEVIAVGYKEKVTLQQIKTFLEMDSQEEKIHEMLEKVRVESHSSPIDPSPTHYCLRELSVAPCAHRLLLSTLYADRFSPSFPLVNRTKSARPRRRRLAGDSRSRKCARRT
jgi:hypothetical protein